jgi:hypothetical protein
MKGCLISVLVAGLIILTLLGISGILPGGDGIVAERTLPDGTQLLITQTHGTAELGYEVGFYFRSPNSDWGWCYLDHEDSKWYNGRIDYDEASRVATIWKGSTLRGKFTFPTMKWERPDVAGWVSNGPHPMKEPPFKPTKSEQDAPSNR